MKTRNIIVTGCLLAAAAAAQANLITNGSFEDAAPGYTAPTGTYTTLASGSTAIDGWTVSTGSIDWIRTYWTAQDGLRSIDLSGNQQGLIVAQTVETVQNGWYQLSFWMAGNPDNGPTPKTMDVLSNGAYLDDFAFDTTGHSRSAMGWTQHVISFQAASNLTTVGFASTTGLGTNPYGPALDNVSLVAIPAPGAALLAMLGLSIVGWVKRKVA